MVTVRAATSVAPPISALATLPRRFIRRILVTMNTAASTLTDSEFHRLSDAVLAGIEARIDAWLQDDVIDIDVHRTGGLLELSFPDGSKIIVNTQPPLHELWVAARAGGHHYRYEAGRWIDTRDGSEFYAALSSFATQQGRRPLQFGA